MLGAVGDLTAGLVAGGLEVIVAETFPLAEVADAHAFVENRESSGKVVVKP